MRIQFDKPVAFATLDNSFTGEGIPGIPKTATRIAVSEHTTAYAAADGQAWEVFNGCGTTETSSTSYWPSIGLCPRDWAQTEAAKGALTVCEFMKIINLLSSIRQDSNHT